MSMAYALYNGGQLVMVSSDRREIRFNAISLLANYFSKLVGNHPCFEGLVDSDDVLELSDGLFTGEEYGGISVRVVQRGRL